MQATTPKPSTIFFLHFLGGSARGWSTVVERLQASARCVCIDLPGFGNDPANTGYSVAEMADAVIAIVRREGPSGWVLAGHSMGAKVAVVVARRAEDGEAGLAGLQRVVLLAGSPPSPEPMDEAQREAMLGWFAGDDASSRAEATGYISQNVTATLPAALHARAVDDVVSADPAGWRAWLLGGSREDWADRVGVLRTPALIVAGEDDVHLGPDGQTRYMLPHFASAHLVTLPGAKHLLPYERPDEVARLIAGHVA